MIAQYIKEALLEQGKVALQGLGTFTLEPIAADFDENDRTQLKRPGKRIDFVNDAAMTDSESLVQFVSEKALMSTEAAETAIQSFVTDLKDQLENSESAQVEGLGYFTKTGFGQIVFHSDEILEDDPEYFGLQPQISTVPPAAGETAGDANKEKSDNYLLWLILIPVIMISALLIYFFVSPDARDKLSTLNPFASETTAEEDSLSNLADSGNNAELSPADGDSTAQANTTQPNGSDTDPNETTEGKPDGSETTTANPQQASPAAGTVVTEKTRRFYISVGSFTSLENAKDALSEAEGKGYSNAKIVKAGANTFRLSINDFAQHNDAKKAGANAKNDYGNQWIFKY